MTSVPSRECNAKGRIVQSSTITNKLKLAVEAHQAGDLQRAHELYSDILSNDPGHPDTNHNLAVLLQNNGYIDYSINFYRVAVLVSPNVIQYWSSLLKALAYINRNDEFAYFHSRAIATGIRPLDLGSTNLKQILSNSDISKVIEPLDNELRIVDTTNNVTRAEQQKRIDNALLVFPNSKNLYFLKAKFFSEISDLQAAELNYIKALDIDPKFLEAHINLGNIQHEFKSFEKAVASYEQAIELSPDNIHANYNMGVTLLENNCHERACKYFNKVLKLDPDNPKAANNLGLGLLKAQQWEEAKKAFKKAISLDTDFAEAFNNLGDLYVSIYKFEEALLHFDKALEIRPDYYEASHNVIELLKHYSPNVELQNRFHQIDKNLNRSWGGSNKAIGRTNLVDYFQRQLGMREFNELKYKTALSQIYNRSYENLNCRRHFAVFKEVNIIPKFCFGCFKIQISSHTVKDLILVTDRLAELASEHNLTTKSMIELRLYCDGAYKSFIYCKSLADAEINLDRCKDLLSGLDVTHISMKIKRGCSEFSQKYPDFEYHAGSTLKMIEQPIEWNEKELTSNAANATFLRRKIPTLDRISLSDVLIIQKWIDYARGLGDPTTSLLSTQDILHSDIFAIAQRRKNDLNINFKKY